ncbi:unnamed protein product [Durusdinium trenchii]|uniref:EF-hand domain-containing protein n=1 Tax=Durusdinium trenchii TaxID=1381693 RepID=A0ABP0RLN8_9DINO
MLCPRPPAFALPQHRPKGPPGAGWTGGKAGPGLRVEERPKTQPKALVPPKVETRRKDATACQSADPPVAAPNGARSPEPKKTPAGLVPKAHQRARSNSFLRDPEAKLRQIFDSVDRNGGGVADRKLGSGRKLCLEFRLVAALLWIMAPGLRPIPGSLSVLTVAFVRSRVSRRHDPQP